MSHRLRVVVAALIALALFIVTLALTPSGAGAQPSDAQLRGAITDASGEPVEGVKALLWATDDRGQNRVWVGPAFSDASGTASFEVAPGCYRFGLVAPDGFVWERTTSPFDRYQVCPAAGETIGSLDGTLHATNTLATLSGTVTRGGTAALAGFKVLLYGENDIGQKGDFIGNTLTDQNGQYSFSVPPACHFVAFAAPIDDVWTSSNTRFTRTKVCPAAGASESGIDAELATPESSLAITVGSANSTTMDIREVVAESSHGTRLYCPVSHFGHDDPVVRPGEPNSTHLHMFWGNTGADAFSTGESLLTSGNSTCEGGINNRSSYWMPAFFNDQDEVVLPVRLISYYKSFGLPDRSTIQPIPNGLQMLANRDVPGAGPWNFTVGSATVNGEPAVSLRVEFPTCVQVDADGQPVLESDDNVSHLSYRAGGQPNDCPTSHPYRITGLIYVAHFAVDPGSEWYIASDNGGPKGQSLHADYIAAWDEASMAALTRCNIESRNCDMGGSRTQLPERFNGPDGTPVYSASTTLLPGTDRTPFGSTLTPTPQ